MAEEIKGTDGIGKQVPPPGIQGAEYVQRSSKADLAKKLVITAAITALSPAMSAAINAFALISPKLKKTMKDGKISSETTEGVRGKMKDSLAENSFGLRDINKGHNA